MTAVHAFDASTCGEHDVHPFWTTIYQRAFPEYVTHDVVSDVALQKFGIDHRLHFNGGGELLIDVKCRCLSKSWHDDILIEVWSDKGRSIPGWARKPLRTHYIAYGWPQYGVAFLVPFHLLRLVYEKNKTQWAADGVQPVVARNSGYDTVSVAVPYKRLLSELTQAMTIYADESLEPFT